MERPCHASNATFQASQLSRADAGRLLDLYGELVRCLVPPKQLLEISLDGLSDGGDGSGVATPADAMRRLAVFLGAPLDAPAATRPYPKVTAKELARQPGAWTSPRFQALAKNPLSGFEHLANRL